MRNRSFTKLIAFILAALMLVMFTACKKEIKTVNNKEESDVKESSTPTAEPKATSPTPTETPVPKVTPTPEVGQTAEPNNNAELVGTITGQKYENRFLNIGIELEDWQFSTEEELAAIAGLQSLFIGDELQQELNANGVINIVQAHTADSKTIFNITLQNIDPMIEASLNAGLITEEAILDQLIPGLIAQLEDVGMYSNVTAEVGTILFLGEEKPCLVVNSDLLDVLQLNITMLAIYTRGYEFVITFTNTDGDMDANEFFSKFYKLS